MKFIKLAKSANVKAGLLLALIKEQYQQKILRTQIQRIYNDRGDLIFIGVLSSPVMLPCPDATENRIIVKRVRVIEEVLYCRNPAIGQYDTITVNDLFNHHSV